MSVFNTEIPSHVPKGLVMNCRLADRTLTYENPYETIIPDLHRNRPQVFMAPNAYLGLYPGWVVGHAEEFRRCMSDTDNFLKKGSSNYAAMINEKWDAIPTELDPPEHTAWRRVLNGLFTPDKMSKMENRVRAAARFYIEKFKKRGHCDFVREFSVPYPVSIFLDLIGLPKDRMEQFLEWEHSLIHVPDMESRAAGVRAVKAYLMEVIEERRKNPSDDLISNALNLVVDGKKPTTIEVFGHCFNLYVGGLDTVTASVGLHFYHLATHPEQQRELREHPERIPVAMNELLRAYATTSHHRTVAHEVEIGGVTMKPGDRVLLSNPMANRDPQEFDQPNEIRFDRNALNLAFGFGVHNCLGRHLARREVQVALEEVLAAIPEFRIAPGEKVPFRLGGVIHVDKLPLVWN